MEFIFPEGLYLWEEEYFFENDCLSKFLEQELEIREIQIDHIEI
ncbi:MAG: hypothetical protein ACO20H_09140 [Bacteriovoracaceae bacterium]